MLIYSNIEMFPNNKKSAVSPFFRPIIYAAGSIILFSILISASFIWNFKQVDNQIIELAKKEARTNFNKDVSLRLWATKHGGVYVPATDSTPPNPYLSHIPERDIVTPSGKKLTLMNPAYMLRQIMEDYEKQYDAKGHITSLKLLNANNSPDSWEHESLKKFESGEKSFFEISNISGKPYLRFFESLITEEGCLKCHQIQGYKTGDVRGGVGVAIPMSSYLKLKNSLVYRLAMYHALIWILGVLIIVIFINQRKKQLQRRRLKKEQFLKDNKRLEQKVVERTAKLDKKIEELEHTKNDLNGRVKELNCLYGTAEIIENSVSIDLILSELIHLLQKSWQFPEITEVCITYKNRTYVTKDFLETEWVQSVDLTVNQTRAGDIKIVYLEERPERDEGPFLKQERILLDTIASRIVKVIKRISITDNYNELFHMIDDAIFYTDKNGIIKTVNSAAVVLSGYNKAEEMIGQPMDQLYLNPDIRTSMIKKLHQKGGQYQNFEFVLKRKDHKTVPVLCNIIVLNDENGNMRGTLGAVRDITELKKVENKVQQSETKFRSIFENTNVGLALCNIVIDENNHPVDFILLDVNRSFEELTQLKSEQIRGKRGKEVIPKLDQKWIDLTGNVAQTGIPAGVDELSLIDDKVWKVRVYSPGKNQFAVAISDITERIRSERVIASSLLEKETLLQEIHHRVKNNLTIVSSLLNLQASEMDDDRLKDALKESQSRIHAMASVHETLYNTENLAEIDLKLYLSLIVQMLIQTYSVSSRQIDFTIDSDPIKLKIEKASPLGLTVNEIITNSIKYAFPGEHKGKIIVKAIQLDDRDVELIVMDNGIGLPEGLDLAESDSLGMKLVQTLITNQLDGSVNIANENGTKFTIGFNLDN